MYFITTVDPNDNDIRCVGYVSNLKDAMDIVVNNEYDLWETCYKYAVIEHIPEGIYQYDYNPIWFEYNQKTNKYIKISDAPASVGKHAIGFAIG